jgi:hypothetical protein
MLKLAASWDAYLVFEGKDKEPSQACVSFSRVCAQYEPWQTQR